MKKIHNLFLLGFICATLILSIACSDKLQKNFFYDLGEEGMIPDKQYLFSPFDSLFFDKDSFYKIDLSIRYSDNCHIKKLPLEIEYSSLNKDSIYKKKFMVALFDDEDHFKGKGNFGVYEDIIPLLENQPAEEGFFISVSTPDKKTAGLISLGIICKKI